MRQKKKTKKKRDNARNVILQLIDIEYGQVWPELSVSLSIGLYRSDFNNFKVVWPQSTPARPQHPGILASLATGACVNDLGNLQFPPGSLPPVPPMQIVRPWGSHT